MDQKSLLLLILFSLSCCSGSQSTIESVDLNGIVPEGMVLIPEGAYMMGGKSDQSDPDELPQHAVKVSPFFMDQTEVTNEQFNVFVEATGYKTVAEIDISMVALDSRC